jgi:hypothetical protein
MFSINRKFGPQAGYCAIVKSKGSVLPLLGRLLRTGTDGAEAAVVQSLVGVRRPSSGNPATQISCAERAALRRVAGRK